MNWDEYYMSMAKVAASKSKDPSTKVGAVLVDDKQRMIIAAFNGFPRGVPDLPELLTERDVKLRLTLHAEDNALLLAQRSVEGGTCYTWPMPPCAQCAARLVQAGITRIVSPEPSFDHRDRWGKDFDLAEWVYQQAGVELYLVID